MTEDRLDILALRLARCGGAESAGFAIRNCRRIISAYVQANRREPLSFTDLAEWWALQLRYGRVRSYRPARKAASG
jgi:hypothetical protein